MNRSEYFLWHLTFLTIVWVIIFAVTDYKMTYPYWITGITLALIFTLTKRR